MEANIYYKPGFENNFKFYHEKVEYSLFRFPFYLEFLAFWFITILLSSLLIQELKDFVKNALSSPIEVRVVFRGKKFVSMNIEDI